MHRPIVAAFAALGLLLGVPGLSAAQLGTLLKKKAEEMASRAEAEAATKVVRCGYGQRCGGIYFDAGSDRIRPEAAPALREIAALHVAHPSLALVLEGHTDSLGNAEANLVLSRSRAAAVRQALVTTFGANASRLSVRGLGATRPAASNDTPEGRQTNRRVELARSEE
jgi:outer membrane protein OmpA-like peptidoglycan-associated protein